MGKIVTRTIFALSPTESKGQRDTFKTVITPDGSEVRIMDRGIFDRALGKADQKLNEILEDKPVNVGPVRYGRAG